MTRTNRYAVAALLLLALCDLALAQAPSTTVTTTEPTTISVGTIGGQILTWIEIAFGTSIGAVATMILVRVFTFFGIKVTDQMKDQLQGIVVNGLNAAAANVAERTKGMAPVTIKNAIVADAVKYTQAHAAETIKALGLDPQSGEAVEAIKARIETAIVDPQTPTPPVLDTQKTIASVSNITTK